MPVHIYVLPLCMRKGEDFFMNLFLEKVVEDGYESYNITGAGYGLIVVIAIALFAIVGFFLNGDGKA